MSWFFWIALVALVYVLFPRDLIPDYLIGWGWLDDLLVVYMLWRYYRRFKTMQRDGGRTHRTDGAADGRQAHSAESERRAPRNAYEILGVAPDAGRDEIKAAYRRLAAQYHPDKVQHLGREFQELAAARFREIQQAYDELMAR